MSGTMITAVGHDDLTADTLTLVEVELRARLEQQFAHRSAVVRAGAGVPPAFGRAAQATGRQLVVVTPTQGLVPALLPQRDRIPTGELLVLAHQARLSAYDPADRDACVGADEQVITGCRQLPAVWDGSPSDGRDATAHLVAYARAHGVPVEVVWPRGAAREGTSVAPEPSHRRGPRGGGTPSTAVGPWPTPHTHEAGTAR
ncbi:hypothetical protein [Streptomyces griseorubiginosus]|uniref:hypothetical protein n=1 Tax=Streptomyces griseorubiginosus TaxID=67304 RepID=UPI003F53F2F8